jgi:hypothetical protein
MRHGKWIQGAALILAVAGLAGKPALADLDGYYYTYDEIHQELLNLAAAHPEYVRVDSIGYSYATHTPIWAAKVSGNVQVDEDEPALWVNGQCHAEEILGINISLELIRRLVTPSSEWVAQWLPILESMEIHVVPSNNPDGLGVVMSGQDVTYRKNLHAHTEDGHCQIQSGIGSDSCGVDLNRNYPAWWSHGDSLWEVSNDPEQFDYFRGPAALSEPETQAIARQAERERFVAAVAYHSARTSTNHEIVIHPWNWEGAYACPSADFTMLDALTNDMAAQIDGINWHPYRSVAGDGRKGNHHNWIYRSYGAAGLLIEVGTQGEAGMQPQNQATIDFIVDENIDGLNWLCRRIVGYEVNAPGLWAHVVDASTQVPLAARLRIEEVMHPDCAPWYRTDPVHGSYYRLLSPQTYMVKVRKHGYQGQDGSVVVGNSLPTQRNWSLQALPRHSLSLGFQALGGGASLSASRIELLDMQADTLLAWENPGQFAANLPQGAYQLTAWIDGRIPVHQSLVLDGPAQLTFAAAPAQNGEPGSFTRLFDSLEDFTQSGVQCGWTSAWNDSLQTHFKDSPGFYSAANADCRLATAQGWLLDAPVRDVLPGALDFVEFHQFEGGRDSAFVEFSGDNGATWTRVLAFSGDGGRITRRSVPIGPEWAGSSFRFAFRVSTNGILEDQGWLLKDITLSWNGNVLKVDPQLLPERLELSAYPNPFNPSTTLRLNLPLGSTAASASVELFDLLGRQVLALPRRERLAAGIHDFTLDGSRLASGRYFARVKVEQGGVDLWQGVQSLTVAK